MRNLRKTLTDVLANHFGWLALLVFSVSRIATWAFPFDSDHWIFYYVGKQWLHGDVLYLEVWDHKSPLIFSINAGIHALFGDNIVLHRILFTAAAAAAALLFYASAKHFFRLIKRPAPLTDAKVATLLFVFFANLSQFTNSGNNTENFGILALVASLYCYLRWREKRVLKWLLYSGFAVSITVFLKINFSILLLPLVIDFVARHKKNLGSLLLNGVVWVMPTLLQAALWISYFAPRTLLDEFWVATVEFNGKYLRAGWAGNLSGQLIFVVILASSLLFFVGAYFYVFKKWRKENPLLPLIAFTALLFSVILGTFYSHYYLIVIPYFCLVGAAYWREVMKVRMFTSLAVLGLVLAFSISLKQLLNSVTGAAAADYKNMSAAAQYVKDHTDKDDKIIFYGYGATFYRLAERLSATRFISASHPLIDEREGFGYNFTEEFIGDTAISHPKYWIIDQATEDIYDDNKPIMQYFSNHYELETSLEGYEIWKRTD